jgi:hypothetical protein
MELAIDLIDDCQVGQQLGNIARVEIAARRHPTWSTAAPPGSANEFPGSCFGTACPRSDDGRFVIGEGDPLARIALQAAEL